MLLDSISPISLQAQLTRSWGGCFGGNFTHTSLFLLFGFVEGIDEIVNEFFARIGGQFTLMNTVFGVLNQSGNTFK